MPPPPVLDTLPNGLRIVLAPDGNAESVTYGVFVASGSRHESDEMAGVSHFIEHMLFKGTERRSQLELSRRIEGCGGNFNAWTGEEGTCFYARVPHERMRTAVDVISEMFTSPAFDPGEFARERNVVLQELKMYDDEPDNVAAENLSRLLFPGNAVGRPVIGNEAALRSLTADAMREYHKKAYVPAATIAILVGRFDCADAKKAIEDALGNLPEGKPLQYVRVRKTKRLKNREITVKREIQQAQIAIGYRTFAANDPRRYALLLFDAIMGRGMTSRLFQRVREKAALSYDIHSVLQAFDDTGFWGVSAGVDAPRLEKALDVIRRELDLIRTKAPSAAELARIKDYITGNFRIGLERLQSRLVLHLSSVSVFGRIVPVEEIVGSLSRVTREDILDVAQTVLDDNLRATSLVLPK
ncbi:MAG: insulinase family protein [Kiritimatiellae bacterium]|nr:insulinase family protein [Kiritimatiellia bacterium]